jgi:hypothetical protein
VNDAEPPGWDKPDLQLCIKLRKIAGDHRLSLPRAAIARRAKPGMTLGAGPKIVSPATWTPKLGLPACVGARPGGATASIFAGGGGS